MLISEQDRKIITDWITSKCGALRCFCCGNNQWGIMDIATTPVGFNLHTTRFAYNQGMPQVSIICGNCGYIVSFSSEIMGFHSDEPSPMDIPEQNDSSTSAINKITPDPDKGNINIDQ